MNTGSAGSWHYFNLSFLNADMFINYYGLFKCLNNTAGLVIRPFMWFNSVVGNPISTEINVNRFAWYVASSTHTGGTFHLVIEYTKTTDSTS